MQRNNLAPISVNGRMQVYLSKLSRDSVGVGFQSVRKLTNRIRGKPPESRLRYFCNTLYERSTLFMVFPIFAVKLLNHNGLKYQ